MSPAARRLHATKTQQQLFFGIRVCAFTTWQPIARRLRKCDICELESVISVLRRASWVGVHISEIPHDIIDGNCDIENSAINGAQPVVVPDAEALETRQKEDGHVDGSGPCAEHSRQNGRKGPVLAPPLPRVTRISHIIHDACSVRIYRGDDGHNAHECRIVSVLPVQMLPLVAENRDRNVIRRTQSVWGQRTTPDNWFDRPRQIREMFKRSPG